MATATGSVTRSPAATGLSGDEARRRLETDGRNELPPPAREAWVRRLGRQVAEPMPLLLLAAAAVSGLGLGERLDATAILAIVVVNAVIAVVQEGRAERALEGLRRLGSETARVRRDGTVLEVPAGEVVRGDVVLLAAGDRVPADLHLTDANALQIDQAVLTGESLPVDKRVATPPEDEDDLDRAWSGTLVARGSGTGTVTATGVHTRFGQIAERLREPRTETPLQRELGHLTARLGIVAVALAAGVFLLTLVRTGVGGENLQNAFLTAVALAVAAVPEGLAAVTTVALALGVHRMAQRGAIVRRLPAVEALGAADVLAIDKTGTVTENRMRVGSIQVADQRADTLDDLAAPLAQRVVEVAVLCNDATLGPPVGDPLEIALLEAAGAQSVSRIRDRSERVATAPFDADRRRMTVLTRDHDSGQLQLHVKGAPEELLGRCTRLLDVDGSVRDLDDAWRLELEVTATDLARSGARVLALAQRRLARIPDRLDDVVDDLTLIGLVDLRDTIRSAAQRSVEEIRGAGITLIMATGDHGGTAVAVAEEIGLAPPGTRSRAGTHVDAGLGGLDPVTTPVFARVDPEQKLLLVDLLHDHGHVVAMTGDGVNDAPALRRADIGVALGRGGSDVARDAADLVITDDDLATIAVAVREGRAIYDNIRKVVDYLVAGNLSEIAVVVGALLAFPELGIPLLPLQLLWINLLTDGLPAVALGVDPVDRGLMRRPPRPADQRLLTIPRLARLAVRGVVAAAAALASGAVVGTMWDRPWPVARTVIFTTLVLTHLAYAYVARRPERPSPTHRPPRLWSNPTLAVAIVGGIGLQVAAVAIPAAREILITTVLAPREWGLAVGAAALAIALLTGLLSIERRLTTPTDP